MSLSWGKSGSEEKSLLEDNTKISFAREVGKQCPFTSLLFTPPRRSRTAKKKMSTQGKNEFQECNKQIVLLFNKNALCAGASFKVGNEVNS